jgi:hypothetical protein
MSAATFQARHPGLVWSNSQAGETVLIRAALMHPRFHTILDACMEFGLERVRAEWEVLTREAATETRAIAGDVTRILKHIEEGFADAQTRN